MVLPHPWGNHHCPDKLVVGYLEQMGMGWCQAGLQIPQQEGGCLQMQALKQGLIENAGRIQPALALQLNFTLLHIVLEESWRNLL